MEPPPYSELQSSLDDCVIPFTHDWDEVTLGITPQTISPKTYLALRILSDSTLQLHLDEEKAKRKGKKSNDPAKSTDALIWSRLYWRVAQTFDEVVLSYGGLTDLWIAYRVYSSDKDAKKMSDAEALETVVPLLKDLKIWPVES